MKNEKIAKNEKKYYLGFLALFVIALVIGIKSVYAYYSDDETSNSDIFASTVGNVFEYKDGKAGDVTIRIYKKIGTSSVYTGNNAIPTGGSIQSVSCSNGTASSTVTCTNGISGSTPATGCHYSYDSSNGKIKVKSDGKAICSFYFN